MSPDPADFTAPRPLDPREIEIARMSVAAPAVFMILNGILGLVIIGLLSVPLVFDPDSLVQAMKNAVAQQPPGPEKQDLEQKVADFEKAMDQHKEEFTTRMATFLSIGAFFNLLAIVGGLFMRRLSNYTLSMIGGVVSVIPIATGCLLTGIPFGIWVLIVLNRAEIKAAYLARRNAVPPNPDEHYLR
jgi:hypothetical protein